MAKRPSLAESMKAVQPSPAARVIEAPAPAATTAPAPRAEAKGYFAATRVGKKRVTLAITPDEHKRLKRLSADTDRTIEQLMKEALDDLFAKLG